MSKMVLMMKNRRS